MAAMTYLGLTQELASEAGASGGYEGVVTCQNQTGELGRLCRWIKKAYVDVQETHEDWGFLEQPMSFVTVSQQATYTPAQCGVTDLGKWKKDSFRSYITASGYASELHLGDLSYADWYDSYQFGARRTNYSRPLEIAVAPQDKSLCLGFTPDSALYTIVGRYFQKPFEFSADADTPVFASKFHMMIVWRALVYYGQYESAPEAVDRGKTEFNRLMRQMESDQLPTITTADPLA